MRLKIDVDIGELSISEYFILYCINYMLDELLLGNEITRKLIKNKYIIYLQAQNRYILTAKAKKLFNQAVNINIEQLAKEYRALFPNLKIGAYPVRSNLKEIEAKFERFFKKYSYDTNTIIEATKLYLQEKELSNWNYISTAKHFIIKKKPQLEEEVSELSTYCDHYLEKGTEYVQQQSNMI